MEDTQKKLNLYKFLGASLIDQGQRFLAKAHHVKITQTISGATLSNFLKGLGLEKVYNADHKFCLTSWKTWESLIKYDWVDRKKYLAERRDCDNFADAFAAQMSVIYGLNTAGRARGIKIIDANTGKFLNYHRANLIVATGESGNLVAYALEPQTDEYAMIKKNQPVTLRNWLYQWNYFEFG